jgi:hypothetical protein
LFSAYGAGNDTDYFIFGLAGATDSCKLFWTQWTVEATSTAVFRDPSAWYHIVANYNGSNLTFYVNNVQVLQSAKTGNLAINGAFAHSIGRNSDGSKYFSGYLADIYFIDGQALTPSSFTETDATTGQLVEKAYTGSYGSQGWHLEFADNSSNTATTLGKDTSGNGNNWDVFNISTTTGGPTSVAAASGALPIYNTTDTYGTTKGTGTRTDSNSSSIVLAVAMDGTNNGTTFTDESATIKGSGSAKTITRNNAVTSTAQSKFYGSSGAFDGTGDYLTLASSSDFDFGTGDFTIEAWVYLNSLPSSNGYPDADWIVGWGPSDSNPGFDFAIGSTNIILAISNFGSPTISTTHGLSSGKWYHVAATRSGSTARVFVDGVLKASATTSETASTNPNGIAISAAEPTGATSGNLNGYLQDLRIYKGVAKYTGNFNPPSSTANVTIAAGNDSLVDVPTSSGTDSGLGGEVRGNYATLNPLALGAGATLSNGNLDISTDNANYGLCRSTIGVATGKFYCEYTIASGTATSVGICTSTTTTSDALGFSASSYAYYASGQKYNNSSAASYGTAYGVGDVIGIALDMDSGTLTFYRNGTSQGQAYSGLSGTFFFAVSDATTGAGITGSFNFGQRPFAYTAPSGFKALCTANLPTPAVVKSNTAMDVVLYTGTGSSLTLPYASSTPTSIAFTPDLVWIKGRSGATDHALYDAVRDVQKDLASNSTAAETTQSTGLTAFGTNTFTIGSLAKLNTSSATYAAWAWDAGSSTVTNTQGSITSSVRANATAGFSIVKFNTGTSSPFTVGHGLGAKPALIIDKATGAGGAWSVYHSALGATKFLRLNLTNAADTQTYPWNNTEPTSTVFTGGDLAWWGNSFDHICYCFTPVVGYSSFGSYTGNGSTDGPFVYTGFRPRWVLIKYSSGVQDWILWDAARTPYNAVTSYLLPSKADAEDSSSAWLDFTSNGFKIRQSNSAVNTNNGTYIYAAFAESPFNYARAR